MKKLVTVAASVVLVTSLFGCKSSEPPAGALKELTVTPGTLQPAFTPAEHDYGITCAENKNVWKVNANATDADAKVVVDGARPDSTIDVKEHQLVKINVTKGDSTETYFVRCLPHDFPRLQTKQTGGGATPGWYMLSPGVNDPNLGHYVVILDERGAALWYQKVQWPATNVRRLPDGNLMWSPLLGGSGFGTEPEGFGRESNLAGTLVHSWKPFDSPPDFHDMHPLSNGNMLVGSYHQRQQVDTAPLAPDFHDKWNVLDAWIQEIRPDGSVAWQWHSEDHIAMAETVAHKNNGVGITPFNTLDLVHYNSIEVDPNGDLIVSFRHLDAVYKIRRNPGGKDDGKMIWKLGGNEPMDKGAKHLKIVDDPLNGPARQHWARLLPNGNLTMFDNRSLRPNNEPARAIEYQIDEQAGTAKLVWSFKHPAGYNSAFFGSVQRLPEGNTVIGWGGIRPMISEVSPSGDTLFELNQVSGDFDFTNYSVIKEPAASFNRNELRDNAGPRSAR